MKYHIRRTVLALCLVILCAGLLSQSDRHGKATASFPKENAPPVSFDGQGQISHIIPHDRLISINNTTYRVNPHITYYTAARQTASPFWFLRGDTVGFTLDSERSITSLWLLEQKHKNIR